MEYFRELYHAVGGKLVAIPGAIGFLIATASFLRDRFIPQLPAIPAIENLPLWILVIVGFIPLCFWMIVGLMKTAVQLRRANDRLHAAWDRSGRDLISMRQALDTIADNLGDQWPAGLTETEKRRKAAAKIRQIGLENQIPIWGVEFLVGDEVFQDHMVQIPPLAWQKIMVDVDKVYASISTPEAPQLQTIEDPAFAESRDAPSLYGDLRIKAASVQAAFPAAAKLVGASDYRGR